jgi:hypothetical protein
VRCLALHAVGVRGRFMTRSVALRTPSNKLGNVTPRFGWADCAWLELCYSVFGFQSSVGASGPIVTSYRGGVRE